MMTEEAASAPVRFVERRTPFVTSPPNPAVGVRWLIEEPASRIEKTLAKESDLCAPERQRRQPSVWKNLGDAVEEREEQEAPSEHHHPLPYRSRTDLVNKDGKEDNTGTYGYQMKFPQCPVPVSSTCSFRAARCKGTITPPLIKTICALFRPRVFCIRLSSLELWRTCNYWGSAPPPSAKPPEPPRSRDDPAGMRRVIYKKASRAGKPRRGNAGNFRPQRRPPVCPRLSSSRQRRRTA